MPLFERKIAVVNKQLAVGGVLVMLWILALYGIVVGIWWTRLHDYFAQRGNEGGVKHGNGRLAAVALTGHMADVTMGMVLVSESSLEMPRILTGRPHYRYPSPDTAHWHPSSKSPLQLR